MNESLLKHFIGKQQLSCLKQGLRGEDASFFENLIRRIEELIITMPKTYEQDGLGSEAIAYLHYFRGSADFYITEKDCENEQLQAFGWAKFSLGKAELGYISIEELIQNNVELDFYFDPKPIAEILKETA